MSNTETSSETTHKKNSGILQWATGFGEQVVAGLIVDLLLGFIASGMSLQWLSDLLSGVGNAYVQLLRVMVPPLIFAAVVTSVANLRKVANAAALAVSTLVWFAITAFLSVLVGIVVALVMRPGVNSTVDPSSAADPSRVGSWTA